TATNTISVANELSISAGAVVSTSAAIDGGTSSSKVATVSVNGTLATTSYLNAENFTVTTSGIFRTAYSGTSGWWNGATAPQGALTLEGSVTFNANSSQTIPTGIYSALTLSGSGT